MDNEKTNIHFTNPVKETQDFHVLNYYYMYNGGGVAIADIDNDGLQDVYFTSNQQSNKLYLNKGDFKFEDITNKASVSDSEGWTTGVNMIDINNDGWMDIYVCKSASLNNDLLRRNKLFINQKNGTFKEEAQKWGIDDDGFSVQSYFFDYDKDGDLDMYLINHRADFLNSINLKTIIEDKAFYPQTSDHLYRNDGSKFTDVTMSSGIMNKEFSLSASIGDYNNDGWLYVFVANDFITPDKLYINNKNGTFSNQIDTQFKHISYSSMGVASTSSTPRAGSTEQTTSAGSKRPSAGFFTDIAQIAGVSKTDWSWAPLIADFDADGYKDVFVTNGIKREIANQDFGNFLDEKQDSLQFMPIEKVLSKMPSEKLQNYAFKNNKDLTFKKVMQEWGLDMAVNSNGVAYGDLDNDGDLDLVVNNLEDEASIYKNNTINNYINIKLVGDSKNMNAIGSKVKVALNKIKNCFCLEVINHRFLQY
ncbi:MAG: VCBS repeat-containing protein [Flavobacteriaceae bacterium]